MLKNYLIIALRNLLKNGTFSLINILGLAIGIASTLLISHYVNFEKSYEDSHANGENVFRITLDLYNGAEFIENDCETYQVLGPEFKEKMPEVIDYVRFMNWDPMQITANKKASYEQGIYLADPSAFSVFSYTVLQGDPIAEFDQPYKAVLTESVAKKYYGRIDVVGEDLIMGNSKTPIEIVAVIEDLPQNTHLKFDILISHATIPKYYSWYEKYPWGANNEYTYLLMEEGTEVEAFNKKLKEYSLTNEALEGEIIISERIKDIHLYSNKTFEPEVNGSAQIVNFMTVIAIFIMIIAWVNYVNLSTARATERAKEVGIRKVVGSSRKQLLTQFVLEAFIVNLIAAALAYTFVQISIPFFQEITGQPLSSSIYANAELWLLLLAIILIGTVLSGIYPALVLSSFRPAVVLKGKFKSSSFGTALRKGLIVFQFLATVVLMSVSVAVYQQVEYLSEKDLGVDISQTIALRVPQSDTDSIFAIKASTFKTMLQSNAHISLVAQSSALPGGNNHEVGTTDHVLREGVDENEGSANYYNFSIDHNYLSVLDLNLAAGKNFIDGSNKHKVIINKRAVETLGFDSAEDAVGKRITFGGGPHSEVIGVVENYHQRSPKETYVPMILYYGTRGDFFVAKIDGGDTRKVINSTSQVWESVFAGAAFDFFFLDDRYAQQYETDRRFSKVTALFTILSIIIASLGLFGLSSFTILQRTKEIGVRKVLGASVSSIVQMLSKDFLKLIIVSGVLAIPIAYYLIGLWLENYANKITISWWLLAIPFTLIIAIAFVTILGQTIKSAMANPVDSLKYE